MSLALLQHSQPLVQGGSLIERLATSQQRIERWEPQPMAPNNLLRLSDIRSPSELSIDRAEKVAIEKGDLSTVESETYLCHPTNVLLSHHSLTLKRLHCRDRQTFDTKFFECDQLRRFATGCLSTKEYSISEEEERVHIGHPCIVTLHAFWSEEPPKNQPYIYKTVVLLLERPAQGSLINLFPQLGPVAPRPPTEAPPEFSERILLSWAASLVRGLLAFHNGGIVHGGVSPANAFMSLDNSILLGPPCRAELEGALRTARGASRLMVGAAIPTIIMYWAPELLAPQTGEETVHTAALCNKEIDLWALGVTLYELAARKHAFPVGNEEMFREAVMSGTIDMEPLNKYPTYGNLVKNLIRVVPKNRWPASQALLYIQHYFAIPIQRRWRAYHIKMDYKAVKQAAILIQATYRRYYCRTHYQKLVSEQKEAFMEKIQASYRAYEFRNKNAGKWEAAKFLIRWGKRMCVLRAYNRKVSAALTIQSIVRMIHWRNWRQQVQRKQTILRAQCAEIRRKLMSMELIASELRQLFSNPDDNAENVSLNQKFPVEIPISIKQYLSIEDYELVHHCKAPSNDKEVINNDGDNNNDNNNNNNTFLEKMNENEIENSEPTTLPKLLKYYSKSHVLERTKRND